MRIALVGAPARFDRWAPGLEARGWVVDTLSREDLISAPKPMAALQIADGIVVDAGDLSCDASAQLLRLVNALSRDPDVMILPRDLASRAWPDRNVVYEEDGAERGLDLLDLWLQPANAGHRPGLRTAAARGDRRQAWTTDQPAFRSPAADSPVRDRWDRHALGALCDALVSRDDSPGLMDAFTRTVSEACGIARYALFYGGPDPAGWLAPVASGGTDDSPIRGIRLSRRAGIGRLVCDRHAAVCLDHLDPGDPLDEAAGRELRTLGFEAALPVSTGQRIVAVLLVGRRLCGGVLGPGDIELLAGLFRHLAHAVARADARAALANLASLDAESLARMPAGVAVVDAAGRVLRMNAVAREILGVRGGEGKGLLRALPAYIADRVAESLDAGAPVSVRDAKDPMSGRVVDADIVPWESERGRLAVLHLLDRTDRFARDRAGRVQWQDALLQRVAERSSHEFGNTLVAFRTFAELLPEQYNSREFREEFAGVVSREVERIQRFLGVLDRLAHPPEPIGDPVDLPGVLQAVVGALREEFGGRVREDGVAVVRSPGGRPVEIEIACREDARVVAGSSEALHSAFLNLARNGIQAMPRGGTLSIATTRRMNRAGCEPCVEISVEDEGEGILLSCQDDVFEPFFTTRHVGVGLGLTLVRSVVERHGGSIEIDSTRGRGTTVVVRLPQGPHPSGPAPDARIDLPEPGSIRLGSEPAEGAQEPS